MCAVIDREPMKGLPDVREGATLLTMYHTALLPPQVARLFNANNGLFPDGSIDHGKYFDDYGHAHLASLARSDMATVRGLDGDAKAALRQVLICTPTRNEIGFQARALQDRAEVANGEEIAVQEVFYAYQAAMLSVKPFCIC